MYSELSCSAEWCMVYFSWKAPENNSICRGHLSKMQVQNKKPVETKRKKGLEMKWSKDLERYWGFHSFTPHYSFLVELLKLNTSN